MTTNIHKPRYSYHLRTKQYMCCCVTHDEIKRISDLLGVPFTPYTIILSDRCVDPCELESMETAVERYDRLQVKRDYLRSVVREYGRDKKRLHELGFLPA